jgi:ribosomal protein S20
LSLSKTLILQRDSKKTGSARTLKVLLCAYFIFTLMGCSSAPIVETVTTDASRASALPAGAQPVAIEPNLPARDPDIEAAGDRIAEAITYLNTHRKDRREVALRALNQAETTITHALRNSTQAESVRSALRTTLKDLDSAEHAVQRNAPDAVKQMTAINKSLDTINQN